MGSQKTLCFSSLPKTGYPYFNLHTLTCRANLSLSVAAPVCSAPNPPSRRARSGHRRAPARLGAAGRPRSNQCRQFAVWPDSGGGRARRRRIGPRRRSNFLGRAVMGAAIPARFRPRGAADVPGRGRRGWQGWWTASGRRAGAHRRGRLRGWRHPVRLDSVRAGRTRPRRLSCEADRKSTRLNSSHPV